MLIGHVRMDPGAPRRSSPRRASSAASVVSIVLAQRLDGTTAAVSTRWPQLPGADVLICARERSSLAKDTTPEPGEPRREAPRGYVGARRRAYSALEPLRRAGSPRPSPPAGHTPRPDRVLDTRDGTPMAGDARLDRSAACATTCRSRTRRCPMPSELATWQPPTAGRDRRARCGARTWPASRVGHAPDGREPRRRDGRGDRRRPPRSRGHARSWRADRSRGRCAGPRDRRGTVARRSPAASAPDFVRCALRARRRHRARPGARTRSRRSITGRRASPPPYASGRLTLVHVAHRDRRPSSAVRRRRARRDG